MNLDLGEKQVKVVVKGTKEVIASTSDNLLKSLAAAGIVLEASCGGNGTCGKCKVRVLAGQVVDRSGSPATPVEDGSFLACQVYPEGDLAIDKIQPVGVSSKGEIGGIKIAKKDLKPPVKKMLIKPVYPNLQDNYSLQEMISKASGGLKPVEPYALKQLAVIAPQKAAEATLVLMGEEITSIENGDTCQNLYGVAFDIGTTTVAGMLADLSKGQVVAAAAATNPQAPFGADVISRIKAAEDTEGFARLTAAIRECLHNLILELCTKADISTQQVYLVTIAGNSTMEHLLMGISPQNLVINPYVTAFNSLPPISGHDLGLDINPGGRVQLLPNIASFVGADTVAAIVAVDQDLSDELTLLIDLGTNGELALGNRDKLVVSSTAAGPAFEGAQLSCGMRAAAGAIDHVAIADGQVAFTTIENERPKGICGSGVIKAIAELLRVGVISPSGKLVDDPNAVQFPNLIYERLRVNKGKKEFILAFAGESATGAEVVITQHDVREIQLVKSSIFTGVQILMESLGVSAEQIDHILIAGAFGNYIDLDSALAIGLIPVSRRDKIRSVGNAAGAGAAKALMSETHLQRCFQISQTASFIELANHREFQKRFIANLSFPGGAK